MFPPCWHGHFTDTQRLQVYSAFTNLTHLFFSARIPLLLHLLQFFKIPHSLWNLLFKLSIISEQSTHNLVASDNKHFYYAQCLMSQEFGQAPQGIDRFCFTMTGVLAEWFKWLEMPGMAQWRSQVLGLSSGCWLCFFFFSTSHLLELECLRWFLHSHVWCLHWDGWNTEAGQASLHVPLYVASLDSLTWKSQDTQTSFMVASFPQSIKRVKRQTYHSRIVYF